MRSLLTVFALCLLSGCGSEQHAVAASSAYWTRLPDIVGVVGNYTPWLITAPDQVRVFANTAWGEANGIMFLRDGNFASVGDPRQVLAITDPRDDFIRTFAVAQGQSGRLYALLHTGDGYPTQGGYSPSWAVSSDNGESWAWTGPCATPFGRFQSDAAALVVDEARDDDYRFMAWETGTGVPLTMMHSADGLVWQSDRENVWPIPGESPCFPTAAKATDGYHIIAADQFPAQRHRHIFSETGLTPWRVVEDDAPTRVGDKGTHLAVLNGRLHALTGGAHWAAA